MPPRQRSAGRNTARTAKAAPPPVRRTAKDVTEYADKPATPYQKAFARWAVDEVGYNPEDAPSKRSAFLRGLVIGVAARPAFNESDYLADWRERTGETKRGRKPQAETDQPRGRATRRPEPEPEPESDDFEDEYTDDADESDDFEDASDDANESDDDDFVDEAPAPRKAAKAASRPQTRRAVQERGSNGRKTGRRPAPADDDDEILF